MTFDQAYFDAGVDRRGTQCEKWDDPRVLPEGGVPLWVADMDFPCAPAVVEAVRRRAAHPCYGYSSGAAEEECTAALCAFWRRRHGLALPRDLSIIGCDDLFCAPYLTPALTSVDMHQQQLGGRAVEMLLSGENHRESAFWQLVERDSCAPAKQA